MRTARIGVLLLIYGIIIVVSELTMPTPNVIMADLRPGLWWGGLLTVIGGSVFGQVPAGAGLGPDLSSRIRSGRLRWIRGRPVPGR